MDLVKQFASDSPLLVSGVGLVGLLLATERLSSRQVRPNIDAVESASVRWGPHNSGHVVELEVKLFAPASDRNPGHYMLNVYGTGVPGIAGMFLPLSTNSRVMGKAHLMNIQIMGTSSIKIFIGGRTARNTVLDQLKKRLADANRPIVFELLRSSSSLNRESICAGVLSPQALYEHLLATVHEDDAAGSASPILQASSPGVAASLACRPRERTIFGVLVRFAICPLMSCGVACSIVSKACASFLLETFPHFPSFGFASGAASIASALPPMPASYLQAFDLGVIQGKLGLLAPGTAEYGSALTEASKLMGREVSAADIDAIRGELVKMLTHRSLAQRVMGMFSFINLMWLAAILGIGISVGPVLWLVTKPLQRFVARLAVVVKDALVWLVENVISPVVIRLHQYGVFEVIAHLSGLTLYLHALRMADGNAGTYISISGIAALMCATAYSTLVVNPVVAMDKLSVEYRSFIERVVVPLYPAFFCVPAAIAHQSLLLGFASVGSLLGALGFGVAAFPFCYCIGWDSEDRMVRTTAACGVGLATFVFLQYMQIDTQYLKPFIAPVSVLGGMGHYLGLLICSNSEYWWRGDSKYLKYNISMVASLLSSVFAGNMMGLMGLKNTAITFGVLWLIDKTRELQQFAKLNAWFCIFGGSVAAYYTALWLHANPAFVVSMFTAVD